ncbi:hypothetical protein [Streptomyces sp. NPDC005209]|uniref:hypothetical protein n=1 Tax=Streptomyces sp. NPDC005209 TaxID=3156715 RepID=UPI0033AC758F
MSDLPEGYKVPGHQNGFCPDVAKLRDGATKDEEGRWRYEGVEFVAEVISAGTAQNDHGTDVDLTTTPPGLTLKTDAFPRG